MKAKKPSKAVRSKKSVLSQEDWRFVKTLAALAALFAIVSAVTLWLKYR